MTKGKDYIIENMKLGFLKWTTPINLWKGIDEIKVFFTGILKY